MVLVIVPVHNEEKTIYATLEKIVSLGYDVLVIDDSSTDRTADIARTVSDKVLVVKNRFDNGKGSALKSGYIYSTFFYALRDDDIVTFLDGDGQIDPQDIQTCLKIMMLYQADVVMGNKRHLYSTTNYSPLRTIVSKGYNFMVRSLFGIDFTDTQCGLKVFRKYALDKVIDKVTTKHYAFDIELISSLRANGVRIADAPVCVLPQKNKGAVSIKNIIKTFLDTMSVWFKMRRGCYKCA